MQFLRSTWARWPRPKADLRLEVPLRTRICCCATTKVTVRAGAVWGIELWGKRHLMWGKHSSCRGGGGIRLPDPGAVILF